MFIAWRYGTKTDIHMGLSVYNYYYFHKETNLIA